ncbi:hypothetical protein CYLTODRAFT_277888 [Cylindrobasidium torrendii FP15055 ss-10]|uniref:F-box domain-containing protein n=1 Tax=Cylindrobasidium torrendii FP15055 ss-10 TaxID=1314674 RepID=A0A0D7BBK2_9AGAR|nr:hypothetical protein CYLTODRAFT_277888 [Cylindrobasidium torrendii FP15055 ss-10]
MDYIQSYSHSNKRPTCDEISSFARQRAALTKAIDDVNKLKRRLAARARALNFALSPIRRIPDDLLGYIFDFCVSDGHDNPHMDPASPPWSLTGVCQTWRAVSTASSGLWSSFSISDTRYVMLGSRYSSLDSYVSAVKRTSQLSQQRPLRIQLLDIDSMSPDYHSFGMNIIASLSETATASRIRSLRVISKFSVIRAVSGMLLPSLENLEIKLLLPRMGPNPEEDFSRPISFNFENAPKLRRYKEGHSHQAEINMPWAQLTHSCLYHQSFVHVPKLRDVEVLILNGQDGQFAELQDHRVVLPRLRCLEIVSRHSPALPGRIPTTVFECFDIPALDELKITSIQTLGPNEPMDAFFAAFIVFSPFFGACPSCCSFTLR